jgi:hypothetical protein
VWHGEKLNVNETGFGKPLVQRLILRSRYSRMILMSEEKVVNTTRLNWSKKDSN